MIVQTPEELERECLGTIANVARDIEREAMDGNASALWTQFDFLKAQMRRLEVIRTTIRVKAIGF